jgi:hypothetical protein
MITFDIETGPLSAEELAPYLAEVEYTGAAKDPAKIEAALVEKRQEFIDRAALSAETGRILCIGLRERERVTIYIENPFNDDKGERELLQEFWLREKSFPLVGHNIVNFDLPFLARRSWRLGIRPELFWLGKPWERKDKVIDTMEVWAAGEYGKRVSLNNLARFFGLEGKTGTGDQFAKWYLGGERDRALDYLKRDLELSHEVAVKMGAVNG